MGYPKILGGVSRQVTPKIYTHSTACGIFNKIQYGGRMVLFKSGESNFVIYSTIPYDDLMIKSMNSLLIEKGDLASNESFLDKVSYIIIPNTQHTLALLPYKEKYPNIKVIGMPGCNKNVDDVIDVKIGDELGHKILKKDALLKLGIPETSDIIKSNFEFMFLPSYKSRELVVYMPDQKTLAQGDIVFNLQFSGQKNPNSDIFNEQYEGKDPHSGVFGWITKQIFSKGTYVNQMTSSRLVADHVLAKQATKLISDEWIFDKIIPIHGDTIDRNGNAFWKMNFDI